MKRFHPSHAVVALLIGVIAVPTAMTGFIRSTDDDGANIAPISVDIERFDRRVKRDALNIRSKLDNYYSAMRVYRQLVDAGFDSFELIPPTSVNDSEQINFYLDTSNFELSTEEDAAFEAKTQLAIAKLNALPEERRTLIEGYVNNRFCPPTLARLYLEEGLLDLCKDLLEGRIAATAPVRLENIRRRGFNDLGTSPLRTLQHRLKVLEQSLGVDGASVRPIGTEGQIRPRFDRRAPGYGK